MQILLITLFCALFLLIAFKTRSVVNFKTFAIGNKNISLGVLTISICATFIGPGFSLGFVSKAYDVGFMVLVFTLGYAIQLILTGYLLAPKIQKMQNVYSTGDIIKRKHGSISQILSGGIGLGLLVAFSSIMIKIGGETLNSILNIGNLWCCMIVASIVIIYSFFGGIKASVITDVFQFTFFVILFIILFFVLYTNSTISVGELKEIVWAKTNVSFKEISWIQLLFLFVSFAFGEALVPPYINRALAAKTPDIAKKSFILSGFFFIVWVALMSLIGILLSNSIIGTPTDKLAVIAAEKHFPIALFTLFILGIIGIVMSTLDSLLNSASVLFTRDIINVFKKIDEKQSYIISRVSTVAFGVAALFLSTYVESILNSLLWCYKFWAPSMLPILIFSIILKDNSRIAGLTSIISGIAFPTFFTFLNFSSEKNTTISLLLSTLIYLIVNSTHSYFKRKNTPV